MADRALADLTRAVANPALPPAGKLPADWTADELVAVIPQVLGDPKSVAQCLRLLAARDPQRAQEVIDAIARGQALKGAR